MLEEIYKETHERMKRTVEATEKDFSHIRTGRPSPALLDRIFVEVYGTRMAINQLATIAVQQPRSLIVRTFDKANLGAIERAILMSDLGLNPVNDGKDLRIEIPPLTEERRKELVKVVRKKAEEGKIAIRNIRRDSRDETEMLKEDKEITEDDFEKAMDKIQEITDEFIKKIDEHLEKKEHEIMHF
ncbi:MAG: ribosome recycling factor [bacterium]